MITNVLNLEIMRIFYFISVLLFISCVQESGLDISDDELEQMMIDEINNHKDVKEDLGPLYYPVPYSDCWRSTQPNLVTAIGVVICEESKISGDSVKVYHQDLKHKSWGKYEGNLSVKVLGEQKTYRIDLKCFSPDYSRGSWVCADE